MVLISYVKNSDTSLDNDLRMVVFPALSKPRTKILNSYFLFFRRFRSIPISPPPWVVMILNNLNIINKNKLVSVNNQIDS
jgi:hypothetical protein